MIGQPPIVVGGGYVSPGWYVLPNGSYIYVWGPEGVWGGPLPPRPLVVRPFPANAMTRPIVVASPGGSAVYAPPEQLVAAGAVGVGPQAVATPEILRPGFPAASPAGPPEWTAFPPGSPLTLPPLQTGVRPGTTVIVNGPGWVGVFMWAGTAWFLIQISADVGDYVGQQIGTKPTPPGSQGVPTWQGFRPSDVIPPVLGGTAPPPPFGIPSPFWVMRPPRPSAASSPPPVWIPPNSLYPPTPQFPGSAGFWYFPPAGSGLGDNPADGQGDLMRPFSGSLGIATAQ